MTAPTPNVLWLFEYPTLCGGERSLLATLPYLRQQGFSIRAIAPPEGPLSGALADESVPTTAMAFRDGTGKRRPQEELRQELREALETLRPDVLHANSLAMGRLAGPVTRSLDLPSLAHLRDILGLSRRAIEDLNCQDRLLAVSHATREYHVGQGLDAEKTHVLYNGVDLERFRPRARTGWLHRELSLPPNCPLVGTIGQLVMRKAHDVLARAAAQVARELHDVHFVMVGERYSTKPEAIEYDEQLRRSFAARPLAGRTHFLGSRNDVARILNELDLLVHPSRQEPLGRVLLEAAASGTAILATDVGGTREIFPPEANAACLVPPDEQAVMARRMCAILCDENCRATLGAASRRLAVSRFDVTTAAKQLATYYQATALRVAGG